MNQLSKPLQAWRFPFAKQIISSFCLFLLNHNWIDMGWTWAEMVYAWLMFMCSPSFMVHHLGKSVSNSFCFLSSERHSSYMGTHLQHNLVPVYQAKKPNPSGQPHWTECAWQEKLLSNIQLQPSWKHTSLMSTKSNEVTQERCLGSREMFRKSQVNCNEALNSWNFTKTTPITNETATCSTVKISTLEHLAVNDTTIRGRNYAFQMKVEYKRPSSWQI